MIRGSQARCDSRDRGRQDILHATHVLTSGFLKVGVKTTKNEKVLTGHLYYTFSKSAKGPKLVALKTVKGRAWVSFEKERVSRVFSKLVSIPASDF